MPTEIERKFLVIGEAWRSATDSDQSPIAGIRYRQGYIFADRQRSVRVRVAGEQGYLTIKGATTGITRSEFEYPIPLAHALELLATLCEPPLIEKTRYRIPHKHLTWEVDEFSGDNQGLVIAEVELTDPAQAIALPDWIGQEVSDDPRYYNSNLAKHPFTQW
jgi:CYTH domain-containing protein